MAGKHTYTGVRRARAAPDTAHADAEEQGRPPPGSRRLPPSPEAPARDRAWESWPAGSLPPILQPPPPPRRSPRWDRVALMLFLVAVAGALTYLAVVGVR